MGMNFTPEQQKVIELHNSNILVSAAAGSGKTAVLVERIIRMICEGEHPADIDRLLIVTFTNAAAAEMRERIAAGIAARLEADPGNDHIQKQSALLHNAQITTIDSFSLFLIRNHFNEIGLDPDFRVADEGEIKLLQQEVLGQLLEDAYAGKFVPDDVPTSRENRDSGAMIPEEASRNDFAEEVPGKRNREDPSREARERFHACVEYFCPGGRESVLEQHILNLSRYAGSFPWPAEWLEERKNDYAAGDLDALLHSDYGQYLAERVSRVLQGCLEKLEEVKQKKKGNYNVIEINPDYVPAPLEHKQVFGVTFEQGRQELAIDDALISNIVTENKELTEEAKRDLKVSLIILKYTQSNSVCFVKDGQAIGVGAGQQSRVHCTRLAGQKADNWFLRQSPKVLNLPFKDTISRAERDNAIDVYIGEEYMDVLADGAWENVFTEKPEVFTREEKRAWLDQLTDVTLGSDAFFPFSDNIERAHKSGVKFIAQPGGSVRDDAVIETCNKYGIVMAFTGIRLFHH